MASDSDFEIDPRDEGACFLYPARNCVGDKWEPGTVPDKPCDTICSRVKREIPKYINPQQCAADGVTIDGRKYHYSTEHNGYVLDK